LSINENSISLKPSNLSFEEAASIGYAGTNIFNNLIKQHVLTAWRALIEIAQVKQGQRILINGISGAIGL
jgi:NADPH:quinone reductase-like Zn-dependent oxidoreductase